MTERIAALLVALLISSGPSVAAAQADEDLETAREQFQLGVEYFEEGQNERALIAFQAAYDAAPNYRVLFNLGNVHAAVGNAVEAVEAYEEYLARGGTSITAERREAVEAALEAQRRRIGRVFVRSNVDGATVVIDNVDTDATTPLRQPLELSVDTYTVGLRLPGYDGPTLEVTVAGGTEQTVEIELSRTDRSEGNLRVLSGVSDVEVFVDGGRVGTTPMDDEELAVPPGEREITARRPGYRELVRRVTIEEGGGLDIELQMEIDPAASEHLGSLALALPEADATLYVDGSPLAMNGNRIELPVGRHAIRIEVEERQEHEEEIEIAAGDELALTPSLRWTDQARRTRLDQVDTARVIGWITLPVGIAVTGVSLGFLIWNEGNIARLAELDDLYGGPNGCWALGAGCDEIAGRVQVDEWRGLDERRSSYDVFRVASIIGLVAGAAATTIGAIVLATLDSEEEIDAAASAALRIGPGGLEVVGRF